MASNARKRFEGVTRDKEVHLDEKIKDVRSFGKKFQDNLTKRPTLLNITLFLIFLTIIILPFSMDVLLFITSIIGLMLLSYGKSRKLLFEMPMSSGTFDKKDRKYYDEEGNEVEGIYFFGNDIEFNNEEIWFSDDNVRRHMLLFGTTGAGKTEALLSLCYNALLTCSGFIFSDGKGTFELYFKVFNTCRMLGVEDDLLLISFLTGSEDVNFATEIKYSNTLNPFASASVDAATNLLVSLMSDGSGDGMWKDRASVLMEAVMRLLVYRRDNQKRLISVDTIREALILNNLYKSWNDAKNTTNPDEPGYLSNNVIKSLHGYLVSLPGFDETKKFEEQPDTINEQHGYLFMQFTKLLGSLADMYGYIFNTQLSEVDFWDVVANRRVLVVLLPALAKSQNELSMLGKIIIACIKQMAASGLGKRSEGDIAQILRTNPTNSKTAFIAILDEFGYYSVPGTSVIPAQARGLGFFMVFAGQDFPAFAKNSKEEAESIKANCTIQVCMKLQDEKETFKIFADQAGQAEVAVSTGKAYNNTVLKDNETISYEKRDRITFKDLNSQGAGEAHFFYNGKMARGRFFYVKVALDNTAIRVNQFIKVIPPEHEAIIEINNSFNEIKEKITNMQYLSSLMDDEDDESQDQVINEISTLFNQYVKDNDQSSTLASCATIAHVLYNKSKLLEREKAKRNILSENSFQSSWIKNDTVYDEEQKQYIEDEKDFNMPNVKNYGVKESKTRERMIKRHASIDTNMQTINNQVNKTMENINQLASYPKEYPEIKKPREISDLIDYLNQDLSKIENKENDEELMDI